MCRDLVLSLCPGTLLGDATSTLEHISSQDGAGFGAWRFGVALWGHWDSMERDQDLGTVTLRWEVSLAGLSSSLLSPNPYSLFFPVLPSSEKEQ